MRAIRTKKWKLIANFEFAPWQETSPDYNNNAKSYVEIAKAKPTPSFYHPPYELYNLKDDPLEQDNLANKPEFKDILVDLIRQLRQWMRDTEDPLLDGPITQATYKKRMKSFLDI